ncbi:MAG: hypothetical protein V3U27_15915, partial [Candidatus Tectomicrobia bacterium]
YLRLNLHLVSIANKTTPAPEEIAHHRGLAAAVEQDAGSGLVALTYAGGLVDIVMRGKTSQPVLALALPTGAGA